LPRARVGGDTVTCPWHGSRFDLRTGAVVEGPPCSFDTRLEARVREDKIEIGFPTAACADCPSSPTSKHRPPELSTRRDNRPTELVYRFSQREVHADASTFARDGKT